MLSFVLICASIVGTIFASELNETDTKHIVITGGSSSELNKNNSYSQLITIDKKGKVKKYNITGVITTNNKYECGPVALANVFQSQGKNVDVKKISQLSKTSKKGASMSNLVKTAKKYGFYSEGVYISHKKLKKNNIVFLKNKNTNGHYVVIKGIKNGKVYIIDSVIGKTSLSLKKFKTLYSGMAIVITKNKYDKQITNNKKVSKSKMSKVYGQGYKDTQYAYLLPSGLLAYKVDFVLKNPKSIVAMMEITFTKLTGVVFIYGFLSGSFKFKNIHQKNSDPYKSAPGDTALVLPTDRTGTKTRVSALTPYAYSWYYVYTINVYYFK